MFNAQAPVPLGAQPPMMAPGAPTFQMPGVLPMAPGVPFGQMVKVPDHCAANIGQPLGTAQVPVRAQPRMMPAGAPVFPVPGVWPNQPLGVSVGHSLSLNVGQPLGMPFTQPMTFHGGQHAMDLTREGQVEAIARWPTLFANWWATLCATRGSHHGDTPCWCFSCSRWPTHDARWYHTLSIWAKSNL